MKKVLKNLALCTFLFAVVFVLTGCSKTAITANTFKSKMSAKDYKVVDVTSQYSSQIPLKTGYIAVKSDDSYQIEFYELNDASTATSMFNNNKSIFESSKANSSAETTVNGSNFNKYTLTTGNQYKVVCRVDNTLIYLNVADKYKDEVKGILDNLGY